jgi:periplasmic protein TonB
LGLGGRAALPQIGTPVNGALTIFALLWGLKQRGCAAMTEHRFFLTFSALLAGVILICSGALIFLLRPASTVQTPWPEAQVEVSEAEAPLPQYDAEALARQIDEADAALLALDLPEPDYTGSIDTAEAPKAEVDDAEPWWRATSDNRTIVPERSYTAVPSPYSAGTEALEANVAALQTAEDGDDIEGLTGEGGSDAEFADDEDLADAQTTTEPTKVTAPAPQATTPQRPQPAARSEPSRQPQRSAPQATTPQRPQPAARSEPSRQPQRSAPREVVTTEPQGPFAMVFGGSGGGSESAPMMLGPSERRATAAAPARSGGQSAAAYGRTVRAMVARNKPRARARGTATVAFAIRPNGGLGAVQIRRSSGNATVDQLAAQAVRNAAPFPAPPAGAPTSYSVSIRF